MANTYSTTNLVMAAALRSRGHQLAHVKMQGKQGTFAFADVPQAEVEEYLLGNCRVEPEALYSLVRALSQLVKHMSDGREQA